MMQKETWKIEMQNMTEKLKKHCFLHLERQLLTLRLFIDVYVLLQNK
jgi:hypothetical protein